MTRCQWCAGVFNADGTLVDPKPEHWGTLPTLACHLCERLEKICTKEPKQLTPMTRTEKFEAGIIATGKPATQGHKLISVERTLQAVDRNARCAIGRSCLPAGDRD